MPRDHLRAFPLFLFLPMVALAAQLALAQSEPAVSSSQQLEAGSFADGGMTHFMTVTLRGGYVAAGTGLAGVSEATIVVDTIPADAQLVGGVLYWAFLDRDVGSRHRYMRVNDGRVEGELIGQSSGCWLGHGSFVYRAVLTREQLLSHEWQSVGGPPPPLPSGNGIYVLSGFPREEPTLPQGATLVLVYEKEGMRARDIVFTDGNVTPRGRFRPPWWMDNRVEVTGFTAQAPVEATSTFIVGNGSGSEIARDRAGFQAASGASRFTPGEAFNSSDGRWWDTEALDLPGLIEDGDRTGKAAVRIISTRWGGLWWIDCLVWAAHVMSVTTANPVDPDPGAFFVTGDRWARVVAPPAGVSSAR